MSTFPGFSARAVEFYAELETHNTREFWAEHKAVYEAEVREPMTELLEELEAEFGPGKLFRPHRDIRFSKDKTPYKTAQGALAGSHRPGTGYYVQIDAGGLLAGGGFRSHSPAEVESYRNAVDDENTGTELGKLVAALEHQGLALQGDQLKTKPRGYDSDHPRLDLLRRTSLMATKSFGTPGWLASARSIDEVRSTWRALTPLVEWTAVNVTQAET